MKSTFFSILAILAILHSISLAQDTIESQRRALHGGGKLDNSGASIKAPEVQQPEVQIITYTAVCESRQWTDVKGRKMIGRLLAFSAPKEGEKGPILVIVDEKVRFLVSGVKKPIDFPLAQLSEEDRKFAENIAKQAKQGPPKPPTPKKEEKPEAAKPESEEKPASA